MFMFKRFTTVLAASLLLAALCLGQTSAAKKSYVFKGKVEGVNAKEGTLKVNNERVAGWMEPMVMDYKVDDAAVLKTIRNGDQITATVYDGDYTLHKVETAKPAAPATPKK